jgi:hypothetical protein
MGKRLAVVLCVLATAGLFGCTEDDPGSDAGGSSGTGGTGGTGGNDSDAGELPPQPCSQDDECNDGLYCNGVEEIGRAHV